MNSRATEESRFEAQRRAVPLGPCEGAKLLEKNIVLIDQDDKPSGGKTIQSAPPVQKPLRKLRPVFGL